MRLLERVVAAGNLAVMAHLVHGRELATPAVRAAVQRLRSVGAVIRAQVTAGELLPTILGPRVGTPGNRLSPRYEMRS